MITLTAGEYWWLAGFIFVIGATAGMLAALMILVTAANRPPRWTAADEAARLRSLQEHRRVMQLCREMEATFAAAKQAGAD